MNKHFLTIFLLNNKFFNKLFKKKYTNIFIIGSCSDATSNLNTY